MTKICFMCKKEIINEHFDINTNHTTHSNLILKEFLNTILPNLEILEGFVCLGCFSLLNNLDLADVTYKQLRVRVINHFHTNVSDFTGKENERVATTLDSKFPTDDQNLSHDRLIEKTNYLNIDSEIHILDAQENNEPIKTEMVKDCTEVLKPYKCTTCWKSWKTLSELRNHVTSHSTERPFICEICGQAYKQKSALAIHVGMHNGITPFRCSYCNKTFTQKGALQRHLPLHTGEAPYQCDLCGKRFVHHSSFNIHKTAHSGAKAYKCPTCGYALLSSSHLKRHMRVHTGERRYACHICGKRFAERYNMVSHQRLHHASETSGRVVVHT